MSARPWIAIAYLAAEMLPCDLDSKAAWAALCCALVRENAGGEA